MRAFLASSLAFWALVIDGREVAVDAEANFVLPLAPRAALTTAKARSVVPLLRGAFLIAEMPPPVVVTGTEVVLVSRSRSIFFRKGLGRFSSSDRSYSAGG